MISFSVYAFEEMRLPMELLAAMLIFLYPFADKKPHFIPKAIVGYIVPTLLSLLYFVIFGINKETPRLQILIGFWYLLFTLIAPIYGRLCFYISISDAFLFGGLAFALQNIVYNVFHIYISSRLFPYIRSTLIVYIICTAIFTDIIYYIVYKLYRSILNASNGIIIEDNFKNILTYSIIFILIYSILIFYQVILKQGYSAFDQFAWSTGSFISLLILLVQYNAISAMIYSEKTQIMENMIRNSEHYYELSKEHIAIINRKCHDLKHQLKVLRTVSEDERDAYISEAEKSIIFYQDLIYTDNEALNTILAEKGLFCREKGIDFNCSVDNVDLSFIRVSDLYALLGNAIDNAIEYTTKQTDEKLRSISLRISKNNNFVGIQISNPLSYEDNNKLSNIDGRDIITTKSDKLNHGFGLKSIEYLSQKYNGNMEYFAYDGVFTLQIIFLLPDITIT